MSILSLSCYTNNSFVKPKILIAIKDKNSSFSYADLPLKTNVSNIIFTDNYLYSYLQICPLITYLEYKELLQTKVIPKTVPYEEVYIKAADVLRKNQNYSISYPFRNNNFIDRKIVCDSEVITYIYQSEHSLHEFMNFNFSNNIYIIFINSDACTNITYHILKDIYDNIAFIMNFVKKPLLSSICENIDLNLISNKKFFIEHIKLKLNELKIYSFPLRFKYQNNNFKIIKNYV